ncbi:MAG: hypothetical protein HDT27_07810 [Subdoligranulum sp.]|nr:hypothetical protein [Subdoligranulum sp.]
MAFSISSKPCKSGFFQNRLIAAPAFPKSKEFFTFLYYHSNGKMSRTFYIFANRALVIRLSFYFDLPMRLAVLPLRLAIWPVQPASMSAPSNLAYSHKFGPADSPVSPVWPNLAPHPRAGNLAAYVL